MFDDIYNDRFDDRFNPRPINKELYVTAGEFAKLYKIKKDTLLFYDKIGLFRPELVRENGYRYYHVNQWRLFRIIDLLKESGMELKKIKKYMSDLNPQLFLDVSTHQVEALKEKKREIEYILEQLGNTIQATDFALQAEYNVPRLERCELQRYLAFPLNISREHFKEWRKSTIEYLVYCKNNHLLSDFLRGGIIGKENLEKNNFEKNYAFIRVSEKALHERVFIRPAGLYAVMEYKGSYDKLDDAYLLLKQYIYDNGYSLAGNAYELELIGHYMMKDPNSFVIQIAIQIEPA